jgi:hypothetical protein
MSHIPWPQQPVASVAPPAVSLQWTQPALPSTSWFAQTAPASAPAPHAFPAPPTVSPGIGAPFGYVPPSLPSFSFGLPSNSSVATLSSSLASSAASFSFGFNPAGSSSSGGSAPSSIAPSRRLGKVVKRGREVPTPDDETGNGGTGGSPVEKMLRKMSVEVDEAGSGAVAAPPFQLPSGPSPSWAVPTPMSAASYGLAPVSVTPLYFQQQPQQSYMLQQQQHVQQQQQLQPQPIVEEPDMDDNGMSTPSTATIPQHPDLAARIAARPPGLRVGSYHRHLLVEQEKKPRSVFAASNDFRDEDDDDDDDDSSAWASTTTRIATAALPLRSVLGSTAGLPPPPPVSAEQAKRYALIPYSKKQTGLQWCPLAVDSTGGDGSGRESFDGEEDEDEDDDNDFEGGGRQATPKIEIIDTPAKEEKYRQLKTLRTPSGVVTTVPSFAMDDDDL